MIGPWAHATYDHDELVQQLADGATIGMACRLAQVPRRTLEEWLAIAEGRVERLLTPEEAESFSVWAADVRAAQDDGKGSRESWVITHAKYDPGTARWLLARLHSETYAEPGRRKSREAERADTEAESRAKQAEAREAEARAKIRELELELAVARRAAALDMDD